jgi:hemerythrin superfamily protein
MPTQQKSRKSTAKASRTRTSGRGRTNSRAGTKPRPDAIAVLKADHKTVEQLFKRYEKAGDGAAKQKRKLVDEIIVELSKHASIEEQVLYPWAREYIEGGDDEVLEAIEEHHVVKWLLWELEDLSPQDERFDAKVAVMMENVRHHVKEEENELFPDLRDVATRAELLELGNALRAAKRRAPTRPHPRGPDEPPANLVATPIVAALDHAREAGKGVVGRIGQSVKS